jgi:hypothetical protein
MTIRIRATSRAAGRPLTPRRRASGDLAQASGPILEVDDEHVALVAHLQASLVQPPACGGGVLAEEMDDSSLVTRDAAPALDVDAALPVASASHANAPCRCCRTTVRSLGIRVSSPVRRRTL